MTKANDLGGLGSTDRRSFIRKGLVAGGVAAAAPIVTTSLTSPASAASAGQYRVRYQRNQPNGYASGQSDSATAQCTGAAAAWLTSTFLALDIAVGGSGIAPTFTLQGADANCVFTSDSRGQTAPNQTVCQAGTISNAGKTISFAGNIQNNGFVYLLVSCT